MTARAHRHRTYRYIARVVVRRGKATVRICRTLLREYKRVVVYYNGVPIQMATVYAGRWRASDAHRPFTLTFIRNDGSTHKATGTLK